MGKNFILKCRRIPVLFNLTSLKSQMQMKRYLAWIRTNSNSSVLENAALKGQAPVRKHCRVYYDFIRSSAIFVPPPTPLYTSVSLHNWITPQAPCKRTGTAEVLGGSWNVRIKSELGLLRPLMLWTNYSTHDDSAHKKP